MLQFHLTPELKKKSPQLRLNPPPVDIRNLANDFQSITIRVHISIVMGRRTHVYNWGWEEFAIAYLISVPLRARALLMHITVVGVSPMHI